MFSVIISTKLRRFWWRKHRGLFSGHTVLLLLLLLLKCTD